MSNPDKLSVNSLNRPEYMQEICNTIMQIAKMALEEQGSYTSTSIDANAILKTINEYLIKLTTINTEKAYNSIEAGLKKYLAHFWEESQATQNFHFKAEIYYFYLHEAAKELKENFLISDNVEKKVWVETLVNKIHQLQQGLPENLSQASKELEQTFCEVLGQKNSVDFYQKKNLLMQKLEDFQKLIKNGAFIHDQYNAGILINKNLATLREVREIELKESRSKARILLDSFWILLGIALLIVNVAIPGLSLVATWVLASCAAVYGIVDFAREGYEQYQEYQHDLALKQQNLSLPEWLFKPHLSRFSLPFVLLGFAIGIVGLISFALPPLVPIVLTAIALASTLGITAIYCKERYKEYKQTKLAEAFNQEKIVLENQEDYGDSSEKVNEWLHQSEIINLTYPKEPSSKVEKHESLSFKDKPLSVHLAENPSEFLLEMQHENRHQEIKNDANADKPLDLEEEDEAGTLHS